MKNIIKTTAYSAVALSSVATTFALNPNDLKKEGGSELAVVDSNNGGIAGVISSFMAYILGFLGLIAVGFAIYGGFQILTAGGDDDKVKKGKTTLINALLGIFVIMISWALVDWLISGVSSVNTNTVGG